MTDAPRLAIIKAKPTAQGLDAFRESVQSLSPALVTSSLSMVLDRIGCEISQNARLIDVGLQDYALDPVLAQQALPSSRLLPSSSGGRSLFGDLF